MYCPLGNLYCDGCNYKLTGGCYLQKSYSISAEESRKVEQEREIGYMILYLTKAKTEVGGMITIDDAIHELYKRTRFAREVMLQCNIINTQQSY